MKQQHKHIVNALRLELEAASETGLQLFNEQLRSVDLEAMVDRVISACAPPDADLRIDRIEIDAGDLPQNENLFDYLEEKLKTAFSAAISRQVPDTLHPLMQIEWAKSEGGEEELPEEWSILLHYLRTGHLPWYAPAATQVRELLLLILDHGETTFTDRIVSQDLHPAAFYRLAALLTADKAIPLLMKLSDRQVVRYMDQVERRVYDFLNGGKYSGNSEPDKQALKDLWTWGGAHRVGLQVFLRRWLSVLRNTFLQANGQRLTQVEKVLLTPFLQERTPAMERTAAMVQAFFEDLRKEQDHRLFEREESGEAGFAFRLEHSETEESIYASPEIEEADNLPEQVGSYYLTHAGLVLLNAGLLSRSFQQFGWVQHGQLKNPGSANNMRLWMHYLVWGEAPPHEYDLLLGKLFTGVAPHEPVPLQASLQRMHYRAADELLATVIQHWQQLKQTSVPSFQQSFLQRAAMLKEDAAGWQLHVETKPYDILIDHLPWSFSIIRFPWMRKPLFTQWNTAI